MNTHLLWQTAGNQDSGMVNSLHAQSKKIQALVEWDEALHGPAGIDACGTYKTWQQLSTHYGSIKQRPKKRNLLIQNRKTLTFPIPVKVKPKTREQLVDVSDLSWPPRLSPTEVMLTLAGYGAFKSSNTGLLHNTLLPWTLQQNFSWQLSLSYSLFPLCCHLQK